MNREEFERLESLLDSAKSDLIKAVNLLENNGECYGNLDYAIDSISMTLNYHEGQIED